MRGHTINHFRCPTCLRPHETTPVEDEIIRSWNVYTVNLSRRQLTIDDPLHGRKVIYFTEGECLYLLGMVRAAGRTCSKFYLLEYVNGNRPDSDHPNVKIVDVKICALRKKLGPEYSKLIHTEWGVGYRLLANENGEWK